MFYSLYNNYSFLFFNREEEIMYLEFISDVTEDILSRGHISDRSVATKLNKLNPGLCLLQPPESLLWCKCLCPLPGS